MSDTPDMPESRDKRLNRAVAMTVVALSIAMALVNIKDGNIVQNMQAAQSRQVDLWNEYQAARLKLHMEEIAAAGATGAIEMRAREAVDKYTAESAQLKAAANAARAEYDRNNYRDDQFALSDGLASIALATTAIAALVELWSLLWFSWGAGAVSILFAVAGFAQLSLHPDLIIGWLT